jgi:hypothetical protein
MRKLIIIFLVFFVGCCPCRKLTTSEQDSVRIEVRERVVSRIDTVEVHIPAEREERIVEADSSYIETKVAASWARINSDGTLYHSLFTLPLAPKVAVSIPTLHRDSIVYRQQYREVVVEVPKPLTWWQTTQIKGFRIMIILLIAWLAIRKLGNHFLPL